MAHVADTAVTIVKVGTQLASVAATSAATAIPTNSSGVIPTKIRVSATVAACIRLGVSATVVATTGDCMIQPGDSQLMRVPVGVTHFAVIRVAADGVVQVSPLEDA